MAVVAREVAVERTWRLLRLFGQACPYFQIGSSAGLGVTGSLGAGSGGGTVGSGAGVVSHGDGADDGVTGSVAAVGAGSGAAVGAGSGAAVGAGSGAAAGSVAPAG